MIFDDFVPKITDHAFRKRGPEWRILPHSVDDYDITYVIKGNAHYTVNGVQHDLESGDLLCLTSGDIIEAVSYPQNQTKCFEVSFAPLYPYVKKTGKGREVLFPAVSHIGIRQDIIDLFTELTLCWTEKQNGYLMKTQALLMLILHRLSEIIVYNVDASPGDYRVKKIISYISAHYAEKLTVKGLAAQIRLDQNYFGRLFKKETGMSLHQYLKQVRVKNAEDMLNSGTRKVDEVAELCGFSDVIHFYKSFKALRGFPPSRCIPRKANREPGKK